MSKYRENLGASLSDARGSNDTKKTAGVSRGVTSALVFLLSGGLAACSTRAATEENPQEFAELDEALKGKPAVETPYTLFEVPAVRPIAVDEHGLVAVTNTPGDKLELFRSKGQRLTPCGSVAVGLRPVAATMVGDDVWVVNHLSDSVSVVSVDPRDCKAFVKRTLQVGDEPRDIVVAHNRRDKPFVFVTAAHRGQNVTNEGEYRDPQLTTPGVGRADVFVFDPVAIAQGKEEKPLKVINLFTDSPRGLVVAGKHVYAAGFLSGNQTAVIRYQWVIDRGRKSLAQLDRDGDLVIDADLPMAARVIEGGFPAVRGHGRCISAQTTTPPELQSNDFIMDLCVKTDPAHPYQALEIIPQVNGQVTEACSCTNAIGELQRSAPLIVRFFESEATCGANFDASLGGCWLEAPQLEGPAGLSAAQQWNAHVPFNLPDKDVFRISLQGEQPELEVGNEFRHVGTTLFNMAAHPKTGKLFVANTESRNHVRFEGPGQGESQDDGHGSTTVRGHIAESRITVLEPATGAVRPVHLNAHINYGECCAPTPNAESETSLAFPTSLAISRKRDFRGKVKDEQDLYLAALGSDKVAVIPTKNLEQAVLGQQVQNQSMHIDVKGGPVGLTLSPKDDHLFVLTHLTNELVVIDTKTRSIRQRLALQTPEPARVREGRRFLYDARSTSSHGDSACASCHIFGDFDGLAWDLGDPNAVEVKNPGPFFDKPEILSAPLSSHFLALKGAMTTQSLRGMANHGAMHWRGDRRGGSVSEQPDTGAFDEGAAFKAFNVAFPGLNGRAEVLTDQEMQQFTDFVLELTYPPNPIRALDDSLNAAQQRARSRYFGCDITDESYALGECADGRNIAEETQGCNCLNPPRFVLGLEPRPEHCPPNPQCTLEVSDFQNTCHGCHTLDPEGNSEFGIDHPGFFGTSGVYTNDAVAHILKVPHLRNLYQKVGMFGSYRSPDGIGLTSIGDSILGARRGGFFAPQNAHQGDQIRGFGFTHAGEEDTLFHFFSLTGFVRSPSPGAPFPNDNSGGFDPVMPVDPGVCFDEQLPALNGSFLAQLGSPAQVGQLSQWVGALVSPDTTPEMRANAFEAVAGFIHSLPSSNPGSVFQRMPIESAAGQLALPLFACSALPGGAALEALGCFELRPSEACAPLLDTIRGCALWGATLEEILPNGTQACLASGIRDKADMESLMFAFDNNVKPIVGQQVTLTSGCHPSVHDRLELLVRQADRGHCDLVAHGTRSRYTYRDGEWLRHDGRRVSLERAIDKERYLTLTAVPPGENRF